MWTIGSYVADLKTRQVSSLRIKAIYFFVIYDSLKLSTLKISLVFFVMTIMEIGIFAKNLE